VRGVRAAGERITHELAIAVIGGHQESPARRPHRFLHRSEAAVYRLDRRHRRLELPGMPHHVRIGVVQHDEIEASSLDRGDHALRHFGGGHFGLEIIGRNLRGGDENALLAREGRLPPAIEKIRDMGVFLGLGDTELLGRRGVVKLQRKRERERERK
jgi:hypothetical protein